MIEIRLPLGGITEMLGLSFEGPDLPFDELSGWQWLAVFGILTTVSVVGSWLVLRWQLTRMPADYFVSQRPQRDRGGPLSWLARNVAGLLVLVVGLVLLVTPGQGILLILTGVVMLDFPGKERVERWLVRRGRVLDGLNWVRKKIDREPFERPVDAA